MAESKVTMAELMKKPVHEMSLEDLQKLEIMQRMELTQAQIEDHRAKKEARRRSHAEQEQVHAENRVIERNRQRNCTHLKGGKGDALINNKGSDPNGAFADQIMPNGQLWRLCTRCWAQWKPGDTAKTHPSGISYVSIMKMATDNSTSGTCQFRFPEERRGQQELAAVEA